jgi:hypothetical protein
MHEPADAEKKRVPLYKRLGALLWRERRTCFFVCAGGEFQ